MRNHVLSALLLCSVPFCSAEPNTQQEKPTLLPLCAAFERFMESFVGLFKKDPVEGMEPIEETATHLLETAFNIMGGNVQPQLYKEKTNDKTKCIPPSSNELIIEKLADILVAHARTFCITRKAPIKQKTDSDDEENQRKILSLFAGIVKNFFNIAQDPENKDTVLPNLIGMATGIVEIGSEVIRAGDLSADAHIQEIEAYVAQLDTATKQGMLTIVKQKTEKLWSTPQEL